MKLKPLFLTLVLLGLSFTYAKAQSEETLKKYIYSVEKRYPISFSYDSDLLEDVPFPLSVDTSGYTLKQLLELMHEESAFQLQFINDSVVIVRPEEEGTNYVLKGKIVDLETREPLPGCNISNTKRTFGIISDENGAFEKHIRYTKNDTVVLTYMGFKTQYIPIEKFNSKNSPSIVLQEDIIASNEVTVTGYMSDGIRFNRLNNSIQIKPKDLAILPGQTDADLLMSLDALPGISSPDSKAGNLNIRGSSADQTLITFDNIPIYHRGHYFGTLSPFNPKVVEDLNVSRSSFTADKGGRVGGMIDIRTKQTIPDSAMSGIAISTLDGSAYTHIPVIKKKLGVLVAGRSSYPNGWMSPKIKSISDFVFQATDLSRAMNSPDYKLDEFRYNFHDWNAKVIAKPTDKQTISVSFLRIFNELNAKIRNLNANTANYDSIGFNNWGLSGQWTSQWSRKVSSTLSVTKSYFNQNQVIHSRSTLIDTVRGITTFENSVDDLDVIVETNFSGKRKNFLKLGYDLHYHELSYLHNRFTAPFTTTYFSNSNKGYIHSIFTSYNMISHKRLRASVGLRGNYYTVTQDYNLEPRISLNYLLSNTITLKSSAGIQRQFVTQVAGLSIETFGGLENMVWIMADGNSIPVIQSAQVMGGAMFEKNNWVIDVEGYHKHIDNVTVINIRDFSNTNSFLHGMSYTTGMDVLIRKGWKRFDAWISYTLSKSMMDIDSIQAAPFPSLSDQRHILDIAGIYKWKNWKFSAGWKYRTGMTSIIGIRTRLLHGPILQNPNAPPPNLPPGNPGGSPPGGKPTNPEFYEDEDGNPFYTDKYPDFHQLDISIVYTFPSRQKQWNSSIGLSLGNVYNQKNIIEQLHIRSGNPPQMYLVTRYSIGFAPNLMWSLNF